MPCSGGFYLDQNDGCLECGTGTYSPGGTTSSCTSCPDGKSSLAGTAIQESDCTWGEITVLENLNSEVQCSAYRFIMPDNAKMVLQTII